MVFGNLLVVGATSRGDDVARSCDSGMSVVRRVGRSIRSDGESGEESTRGEYREVNSGSGSNGRGRGLW